MNPFNNSQNKVQTVFVIAWHLPCAPGADVIRSTQPTTTHCLYTNIREYIYNNNRGHIRHRDFNEMFIFVFNIIWIMFIHSNVELVGNYKCFCGRLLLFLLWFSSVGSKVRIFASAVCCLVFAHHIIRAMAFELHAAGGFEIEIPVGLNCILAATDVVRATSLKTEKVDFGRNRCEMIFFWVLIIIEKHLVLFF